MLLIDFEGELVCLFEWWCVKLYLLCDVVGLLCLLLYVSVIV